MHLSEAASIAAGQALATRKGWLFTHSRALHVLQPCVHHMHVHIKGHSLLLCGCMEHAALCCKDLARPAVLSARHDTAVSCLLFLAGGLCTVFVCFRQVFWVYACIVWLT
jgi:hypothetical protein